MMGTKEIYLTTICCMFAALGLVLLLMAIYQYFTNKEWTLFTKTKREIPPKISEIPKQNTHGFDGGTDNVQKDDRNIGYIKLVDILNLKPINNEQQSTKTSTEGIQKESGQGQTSVRPDHH